MSDNWLSVEQRENMPHMRASDVSDVEIDVRLLLRHAAEADRRLGEADRVIAELREQLAAKDAEIKTWKSKADYRALCSDCGGPETTDNDCFCGGSGKRAEQIRGLKGCIKYWRDEHRKLKQENEQLMAALKGVM